MVLMAVPGELEPGSRTSGVKHAVIHSAYTAHTTQQQLVAVRLCARYMVPVRAVVTRFPGADDSDEWEPQGS